MGPCPRHVPGGPRAAARSARSLPVGRLRRQRCSAGRGAVAACRAYRCWRFPRDACSPFRGCSTTTRAADPQGRRPPRPLRGHRGARRRRHGGGLSRPRWAARSRGRDQDPAARLCRRTAAAGAFRAGIARARLAQARQHRRDPQHRGRGRPATVGAGTGRRADARRTGEGRARTATRGARHRQATGKRPRRGPRLRHRASRRQTGQCEDLVVGARHATRFRAGHGARRRRGRARDHCLCRTRDGRRRDSRHLRIHESRAGPRAGSGQAHRHLGVRLHPFRVADGHTRVSW